MIICKDGTEERLGVFHSGFGEIFGPALSPRSRGGILQANEGKSVSLPLEESAANINQGIADDAQGYPGRMPRSPL